MKLLIKKCILDFKHYLIEHGVSLRIQNILVVFEEQRLKEKCGNRVERKTQGLV